MIANIESLKKQFGAIYEISVQHPDTDQTVSGVFRRPTLVELDLYTTLQNSGKKITGLQTIAREMLIAGDQSLVEEDYTFMRVAPLLSKMFEIKVGEIKKL